MSKAIESGQYEGVIFYRLARFFSFYSQQQHPELIDEVFAHIENLRLLQRPDHRYGIAGSIEALGRWHVDLVAEWRTRWSKLYELADRMRPSENDSEITIASQLDYLLMLGIVGDDDLAIARLIRLGMRRDCVGDAAVLLVNKHGTVPVVLRALADAAATTTTGSEQMLPYESIKQLTELAAKDPLWYASVLYVGWRPRTRTLNGTNPPALVITTPDGCLPMDFPKQWDGHQIEARSATDDELTAWRRLQANKDAP